MKELSIEQKAQRYDETIEKLRDFYRDYDTVSRLIDVKEELANLIPELKESEDEKIRKAMIDFFKHEREEGITVLHYGVNIESMIAWLEKQGEKSTDKVEPKFHKGDWVVCKNGSHRVFQVIERSCPNAKYLDEKGFEGFLNVFTLDKQYRPWTIQDAKDGDVLATKDNCICIFDNTLEEGKYPFAYCGLLPIHGFEVYDRTLPFTHDNVYPATKEQRDTLEKAMADSGWAFDFEKKELKKIEKKSVECSEDNLPDFESYLCLMFQKFRTRGICTNGEIIDYVNEHSQKLKDILCHAWSEEDNKNLEKTIWYVEEGGKLIFKKTDKLMSWLKSLKDRYRWKPSDEQMDALHYVTNFDYGGHKAILVSLYEQLKKLK